MKKFTAAAVLTAALCLMFCTPVSLAHTYTYFDVADTAYPDETIISGNVAYVGGVYYMSRQSGGIYYSNDAKAWHFIEGSEKARVISDCKRSSNCLVVFLDGNLAKSYDGVNWSLLHTFLPDTVIHYDNGAYIAFEKTPEAEKGGLLYFSFDAENWFKPINERVLDGHFTVNQYTDKYIINGITTAEGLRSAVFLSDGSVYEFPYSYVEYDAKSGGYAGIQSDGGAVELYYTNSLSEAFAPVELPSDTASAASYFDGNFYIASVDGDAFSNVYKGTPAGEWTECSLFYMPIYKTLDEDKNERSVYIMHDSAKNTVSAVILKRSGFSDNMTGVTLANGLRFNVYGSVFAVTMADRPSNLLSVDGLNWHQADDASAFSILNEHSLRGDYMFVDKTSNNTLLRPKGDPKYKLGEKGVEVRIDGWYIAFDQPPVIINDRTPVPLRAIAESIGAEVEYEAGTITLRKGGNTITMKVGDKTAHIVYYDGGVYDARLDSPAALVNDRTLVPVRFIADTFGFEVDWQADTKTVWLASKM